MKHTRFLIGLIAVALLVLSAGCAPESHDLKLLQDFPGEKPAGFWFGLWHGMIFPITFIVSLFNEKVGVYEVYNVGRLYNFGFILGLFGSIGGMAKNTVKSKQNHH